MRDWNRDECDQGNSAAQTGVGGVIKTMTAIEVEAHAGEKDEFDRFQKLDDKSGLNKEKSKNTAGDLAYLTVQESVVRRDGADRFPSPPPSCCLSIKFYHPGCTVSFKFTYRMEIISEIKRNKIRLCFVIS